MVNDNLPKDIARLVVEYVFESDGSIHHVATNGVQNALGLASRPTSVQEEQRILSFHPFYWCLGAARFHLILSQRQHNQISTSILSSALYQRISISIYEAALNNTINHTKLNISF